MNKKEFAKELAAKTGLTIDAAQKATNAAIELITAKLEKGEAVQFTGFGQFEVRATKEKVARNPQTKEPITVPAGKKPVFKAGKALKDKIK
jgi:DNA-binding protein HU-beta